MKNLFPLFQWHACKLPKLSAGIAKCLTSINKIYIYIRFIQFVFRCTFNRCILIVNRLILFAVGCILLVSMFILFVASVRLSIVIMFSLIVYLVCLQDYPVCHHVTRWSLFSLGVSYPLISGEACSSLYLSFLLSDLSYLSPDISCLSSCWLCFLSWCTQFVIKCILSVNRFILCVIRFTLFDLRLILF